MTVFAWATILVETFVFVAFTCVVELLRRELRELRRELRDWRHELPASGTRAVKSD